VTAVRIETTSSHDATRWALAAWTLARLLLVPVIIAGFGGAPELTAVALTAFVAADICDGVVARAYAADGPVRRSLDSVVDRLAIDACLIGAASAGVLPIGLMVAFLLRDALCAYWCARMMLARCVAIKADWLYRTLNLSMAIGAVMGSFVSQPARDALALGILAFSVVVAYDLRRSVNSVLSSPPHEREIVLDAGALRERRRGEHPTRMSRRVTPA
jgi:phosphatidylglycerophosphate synthase